MPPVVNAVVVTSSMLLAAASVVVSDGSSARCGALGAGLGLILFFFKPTRSSRPRVISQAGGEDAR